MKQRVWAALIACVLLGSCASTADMDYKRLDRENYRQNKRIHKQAEWSNRGRRYDVNELGNVLK